MEWIRSNIKSFLCTIIMTFVLCIAAATSSINNFITGVVLIVLSIVLYFYSAVVLENKNYLSFRSVFSSIWVFTIGLASLRLTNYQTVWEEKTWIYLALAYLVFNIGIDAGHKSGERILNYLQNNQKFKFGQIVFELKENRLFYVCVFTTLISLICFIINIVIKGWIPFLFQIRLHMSIFIQDFMCSQLLVQLHQGYAIIVSKNKMNSKFKKVILYLCILYLVISDADTDCITRNIYVFGFIFDCIDFLP